MCGFAKKGGDTFTHFHLQQVAIVAADVGSHVQPSPLLTELWNVCKWVNFWNAYLRNFRSTRGGCTMLPVSPGAFCKWKWVNAPSFIPLPCNPGIMLLPSPLHPPFKGTFILTRVGSQFPGLSTTDLDFLYFTWIYMYSPGHNIQYMFFFCVLLMIYSGAVYILRWLYF